MALKGGAEAGKRKEETGTDGEASIPEAEGGGLVIYGDDD